MSSASQSGRTKVFHFGRFSLVPAENLLLDGDRPVRVGSRPFVILLALVERAGELVGKDVLLELAWPSSNVDEANLRVHVAGLRKLLGDGYAGARYILNESGRGYRFVAPVTAIEQGVAKPAVPIDPEENLPQQLTRMIGRSETVAVIRNQLRHRHFVTLVGPGGIGKTTVALAVAHESRDAYDDGVKFVDLTQLTDPVVASTVAAAFKMGSLDPSDRLAENTKDLRRMLLVLDNCEHVLGTVAILVEQILEMIPNLHILATSREPIRSRRQWVHRLSPLTAPDRSRAVSATEALKFSAVQLFVERAAAVMDRFEIKDADASVISDICRRLDGNALALELAAGRVDTFGIRGLADLLNDRFLLLMRGRRTALPRHQTLGAAIDWSHDLLPEDERVFFRRLSIFAGKFTLEAAADVVGGGEPSQSILYLSDLVTKSLVTADVSGNGVQYRLLETMRTYASAKLAAANEVEHYADRHARYYKSLLEFAEQDLHVRPAAEWLSIYSHTIDNIRAAIDWATSPNGEIELGIDLKLSSAALWTYLSLNSEFRLRIELATSVASFIHLDPRKQMKIYAELGGVLIVTGGTNQAVSAAWKRVLDLAEALGDTEYKLRSLWGLWIATLRALRYAEALGLAKLFCSAADRSPDAADRLIGERLVGFTLFFLGELSGARIHTERMLDAYVPPANRRHIARYHFDQRVVAMVVLSSTLWVQGFVDRASGLALSTVEEAKSIDHPNSLAYALAQAACPIAIFVGDIAAASESLKLLSAYCSKFPSSPWISRMRCIDALLNLRMGDLSSGIYGLENEFDLSQKKPFHTSYAYYSAKLADAYCDTGKIDQGLRTISMAIAQSEEASEYWCLPELLRIRGELALKEDRPEAAADAEKYFKKSLDLARGQGALSWQLRTGISVARLRQSAGRNRDAIQILAPIFDRFREGFTSKDLVEANSLLKSLG